MKIKTWIWIGINIISLLALILLYKINIIESGSLIILILAQIGINIAIFIMGMKNNQNSNPTKWTKEQVIKMFNNDPIAKAHDAKFRFVFEDVTGDFWEGRAKFKSDLYEAYLVAFVKNGSPDVTICDDEPDKTIEYIRNKISKNPDVSDFEKQIHGYDQFGRPIYTERKYKQIVKQESESIIGDGSKEESK